jgi:molybdopterin-guanine dinucleotide biosynthesis protein A
MQSAIFASARQSGDNKRMTPPLPYGLVLIGGQSRRMGSEKAILVAHGQTFLQQTADRLALVCQTVFISGRKEQLNHPAMQAAMGYYSVIADQYADIGPFSGLLTALETFPEAAWLLLPCDMPAFPTSLLEALVRHRDPRQYATVIEAQGVLQPFGALYEPSCLPLLREALATGKTSLRRFLETRQSQGQLNVLDGKMLAPQCDQAFQNINTPEELQHYLDS